MSETPAADAFPVAEVTPAADAFPVAEVTPAADAFPVAEATPTAEVVADKEVSETPIEYQPFKIPDGMSLPEVTNTEFVALAKELKLDQATAQRVLDFGIKSQELALQHSVEARNALWLEQAKADPQLGGENWNKSLLKAQRAVIAAGDPEFNALLIATGLNNNKTVMKALAALGDRLGTDPILTPGSSAAAAKLSLADGNPALLLRN